MKYGAKPTMVGGIRFASKRESVRYVELTLLQRAGAIRDLRVQPKFELIGPRGPLTNADTGRVIKYIADFDYFEEGRGVVIEDVKGQMNTGDPVTRLFQLKRALMQQRGLTVTVIK